MSIEFGVYVNNRAAVFLGEAYSLERLLEAARLAEDLGLDFVSVGDTILSKPRYSPIPILAAIAGQTSRIKLATGILQPHMRNPVILAQEWATLDVLSGGRTILGAGLGAGAPATLAHEYEVVGISKARRGTAFDEAIQLLKRFWTEEQVTFKGSVYQFREVSIGYRPAQKPHPPICVAAGGTERTAGGSPRPLDRVARLGDGWLTAVARPDEFGEALALMRTIAAERHGRSLGPEFRAVFECFVNVGPSREAARREAVDFLQTYHQRTFDDETIERWTVYGRPEDCAERLAAYVAAGANGFHLVMAARDQLAQVRAIAEDLKPLLT